MVAEVVVGVVVDVVVAVVAEVVVGEVTVIHTFLKVADTSHYILILTPTVHFPCKGSSIRGIILVGIRCLAIASVVAISVCR